LEKELGGKASVGDDGKSLYGKDYWNRLFANRAEDIGHERNIERFMDTFRRPALLDVGSGDGRNAFFFVRNGFDVTCFDYSEAGLEKIDRRSARDSLRIKTELHDVEREDLALGPGFDTICLIHFPPKDATLRKLRGLLRPDGVLFVYTFIIDAMDKATPKYGVGLSEKEISSIESAWDVVRKERFLDDRGEQIGLAIRSR